MTDEKECKNCGEVFIAKDPRAQYCSVLCKRNYNASIRKYKKRDELKGVPVSIEIPQNQNNLRPMENVSIPERYYEEKLALISEQKQEIKELIRKIEEQRQKIVDLELEKKDLIHQIPTEDDKPEGLSGFKEIMQNPESITAFFAGVGQLMGGLRPAANSPSLEGSGMDLESQNFARAIGQVYQNLDQHQRELFFKMINNAAASYNEGNHQVFEKIYYFIDSIENDGARQAAQ